MRLGAQLDARDMTRCTPLHNAAHGTYSALAAVPPEGPAGEVLPVCWCVFGGGAMNLSRRLNWGYANEKLC